MKYRQWYYDSSKSDWWELFDDKTTYDEKSYAGSLFEAEFHMPRAIFDAVLAQLRERFPDKVHGDGERGARSQPLVLKWAACVVKLTENLNFRRAAKLARIDRSGFRKFFHKAMAYLSEVMVDKHVYLPRTEQW